MSLIDVNPDTLIQIAGTISGAYGAVEQVSGILRSITTHQDWTCRERDVINEYTVSNANTILKIDERMGNFSNVMKSVAEAFRSDEQSISQMTESVEGIIAVMKQIDVIRVLNNFMPNSVPVKKAVGGGSRALTPISVVQLSDFRI